MLKLLVADDEMYVREYIGTVLDWERMGITLCGCARDSEEAIQITEKENPDMAFLDINMPGMDGLELTEFLLKKNPDLMIAFVTGYSEFEYARRALQLGAEEYILKPFSPEELENAVRRLMLKIEKRDEERCDSKKDRKILQENLLREMMEFRDFVKITDYRERMCRVGIECPYEYFLVVQMEIHFMVHTKNPDVELWKFSIRNILEEYPMIPNTILYVTDGREKKISILINGKKDNMSQESLRSYFENIQKIIWKYLKISVAMGAGEIKDSLEELYDSASEAEIACGENQKQGVGKLYFYGTVQAEREKMRSKRAEEIIHAVETTIQENYQNYDLTVEKIAEMVYLDASYIRRLFSRYKGCTVVDFLTGYRMQEARKILNEGNLTVSQVAERVGYMDPGYFTKCFKKYFGVTPSNYHSSINF